MRQTVGRILVILFLLISSIAFLDIFTESRADPVEHVYFLHAENDNGIGVYLDLALVNPEPNSTTISVDVPGFGQYKIGESWIQNDNYDYPRNMSGTWTFTMYVYCDDNIIEGQLYAKVYDGFSTRLNSAQNRSQLIGPCDNPSAPVEVIWEDVLDHQEAASFVEGERARVEIWLSANSGGTSGGDRMVTSEFSSSGVVVNGSYLNTTAGNEGAVPYEILQEEEVPCGNSTVFEVVGENGIEGKSISGDFTNLADNDEIYEDIGEDNNPNSLEWIWSIDITPGTGQYSFYLDAEIALAPSNDDNFTIEYSTTGAFAGEEQFMFTVNDSWIGSFSDPPPARYDFPGGSLSGVSTVFIRTIDTNLVDWPQLKDVLRIDRMYIEHVEALLNCSALEHVWVIDNIPTAAVRQIYVNAFQSPTGDADEFRFSYSSTSALGPYFNLFTILNTTDEDYYYNSPVLGPPGFPTLWLKAIDTDRTPGTPPLLDGLFVDHIYLYTSGGGTPLQLHLIIDDTTYASRVRTVEDMSADTVKPTSVVLTLPLYSDSVFPVHFIASDIGSGVNHTELWYALSNGTPVQYPGFFTTSPIMFIAPSDGRYWFFTRALDNALNYEDAPQTYDAVTTVDSTPPRIIDVSPDDSASGVSRDVAIRIRFSETMNSLWVEDAFRLENVETGETWTAADGSVSWNHPVNDTFTFTLLGGEKLEWGTKYTVDVNTNARDPAGNRMENTFSSTFETEYEFDPALLILIIVIATILMVLLFYAIFRRRPKEEEEKIEETVPVQPEPYPSQPPPPPPQPYTAPPLAPPYISQPPTYSEAQPMWQTEQPVEEMWKEDRSVLSACTHCGRFISSSSTFCPYCGVKRM